MYKKSEVKNYATVNGIILCRKMAKKNVVFPTFFVCPNYDIIMQTIRGGEQKIWNTNYCL